MSPEALDGFFADWDLNGFRGGNVTVPHKVAVVPFLARVDADGAGDRRGKYHLDRGWRAGSAAIPMLADFSTIWIIWRPVGMPGSQVAVVLGAGGAARAVAYGLLSRGMSVHLVNRTLEHAEALAAHFGAGVTSHGRAALPGLLAEAGLLVNTTALGMLGKPPLEIDLAPLPRSAVVYDIVYVPLVTPLLRDAAARGNRVVDGLGMLLHQAVPGFTHWFGATPYP